MFLTQNVLYQLISTKNALCSTAMLGPYPQALRSIDTQVKVIWAL